MRGVKLPEAVFDVPHKLIAIFERGIAFVSLRACVADQAERHIDIAFDQLQTDRIGSAMIVASDIRT